MDAGVKTTPTPHYHWVSPGLSIYQSEGHACRDDHAVVVAVILRNRDLHSRAHGETDAIVNGEPAQDKSRSQKYLLPAVIGAVDPEG